MVCQMVRDWEIKEVPFTCSMSSCMLLLSYFGDGSDWRVKKETEQTSDFFCISSLVDPSTLWHLHTLQQSVSVQQLFGKESQGSAVDQD